jgi:hypothetical protein
MITYEMIINAQETVVDYWGEDGKKVIEECARVTPFNGDVKTFLDHCTCNGGNWGGMFLSGIKKLYPNVWEAVPDDMGVFAWNGICNTLILCGVDTSI